MKRYPAGSDWRKWDLHVHVPGTQLNDEYTKKGGQLDWDTFADALEQSDVAVIGITDYFSADQPLAFIEHFKARHPGSEKLLLVNVELRLNEAVNGATDIVHFHALFNDSVEGAKVKEFLANLKTQITDGHGRNLKCTELTKKTHLEGASVTRKDIDDAFKDTFGNREVTDVLLYVAPSSNDGIHAEAGNQRKANLADEIDKMAHAIFGKDTKTSEYFLGEQRFEDKDIKSPKKPVFGGCDAHSFEGLEAGLGKEVPDEDKHQVITWIKADPTYAGLQQTLIEPADRVSIETLRPDTKEPYKVISKIRFTSSANFPDELPLNPNLNAIIGSRSSGKSALLAHIAHAVDPDYTVKQQVLASGGRQERDMGPAAGFTWRDVADTTCEVEWSNGEVGGGNVIYIPQNWLYQISENHREVTDKIRPVLDRSYPAYFREHERLLSSVKNSNDTIERAVGTWFDLTGSLTKLDEEIRQVGEKVAIQKQHDALEEQIEGLREDHALSSDDLAKYQEVVSEIETKEGRLDEIESEAAELDPYLVSTDGKKFVASLGSVEIETFVTPSGEDVPLEVAERVTKLVEASETALRTNVETTLVEYRTRIAAERKAIEGDIKKLRADNKDLIAKYEANVALDKLVKKLKTQQDSLDRIAKLEARRDVQVGELNSAIGLIDKQIQARDKAVAKLTENFEKEDRVLGELGFGIAVGFDPELLVRLATPFKKTERSEYLIQPGDAEQSVNVGKAQSEAEAFLVSLAGKRQKLNQGNEPKDVARAVLTATRDVRFTARLEDDVIGGFEASTMTPGKQALFALTLMLAEAQDGWPLLIDQPEDDLDSRSIYEAIVPYVVRQKRARQIILVTHNANMVIGADAEEVLVANRHGDDRKNKDDRMFDYLTGSLEHSVPPHNAKYELDRMGIREHTCDILDGGEEAFQKRVRKYKL